jgi:glucosamine-6-phosphate deaminase
MQVEKLAIEVYQSSESLGRAAAEDARGIIKQALTEGDEVSIILATGNSQLTFLEALREAGGIDWSKVRVFHLDEYVGIDPNHKASFPRFLREHFLAHVKVKAFHPITSQPDAIEQACQDYEALLKAHPATMVALGWGENGHLAFNDPPYAKFGDPVWVKVVELAEESRRQQVGEGHFASLEEVPRKAITLTIPALLAAKHVLCIVPEERKAKAVRDCLTEPISEARPGSVLRRVGHAKLYLDQDSASKLS